MDEKHTRNEDMPNRSSNKEKAEGSRENVRDDLGSSSDRAMYNERNQRTGSNDRTSSRDPGSSRRERGNQAGRRDDTGHHNDPVMPDDDATLNTKI